MNGEIDKAWAKSAPRKELLCTYTEFCSSMEFTSWSRRSLPVQFSVYILFRFLGAFSYSSMTNTWTLPRSEHRVLSSRVHFMRRSIEARYSCLLHAYTIGVNLRVHDTRYYRYVITFISSPRAFTCFDVCGPRPRLGRTGRRALLIAVCAIHELTSHKLVPVSSFTFRSGYVSSGRSVTYGVCDVPPRVKGKPFQNLIRTSANTDTSSQRLFTWLILTL